VVTHVRNHGILALIALAIVAIPGGSRAAAIVSAVLSLALTALIAYFVGRLYRDRRIDIYGVGDLDRGLLYLAIGGIVVALAASQEFASAGGTVIEVAVLVVCAAALARVFQVWRSY
jgi:TRAP-type C4-dicarboxylate transport system permease small subunit